MSWSCWRDCQAGTLYCSQSDAGSFARYSSLNYSHWALMSVKETVLPHSERLISVAVHFLICPCRQRNEESLEEAGAASSHCLTPHCGGLPYVVGCSAVSHFTAPPLPWPHHRHRSPLSFRSALFPGSLTPQSAKRDVHWPVLAEPRNDGYAGHGGCGSWVRDVLPVRVTGADWRWTCFWLELGSGVMEALTKDQSKNQQKVVLKWGVVFWWEVHLHAVYEECSSREVVWKEGLGLMFVARHHGFRCEVYQDVI